MCIRDSLQPLYHIDLLLLEAKDRYGKEAGEMTVCKLIEEDANIDLRVKGNWTAPWEVKHANEDT